MPLQYHTLSVPSSHSFAHSRPPLSTLSAPQSSCHTYPCSTPTCSRAPDPLQTPRPRLESWKPCFTHTTLPSQTRTQLCTDATNAATCLRQPATFPLAPFC